MPIIKVSVLCIFENDLSCSVTPLWVNENILQSFKSESAPCIKSLKIKSRLCWRQHESLAYCPPTRWSFRVGLNENANSFFATRCCFRSSKNSCFSGNAVHKAALRSQTLLYMKSTSGSSAPMHTHTHARAHAHTHTHTHTQTHKWAHSHSYL